MMSREYWRRRSEQIAILQYNKADEYVAKLLKEYRRAIRNIERDIEVFYVRYADNNEITMDEARKLLTGKELNDFKMTLEEFIEKAKDNADGRWTRELNNVYYKTRISRLEALLIQIRQEIEMLVGNIQSKTESLLEDIYKDTYYRTIFEIQRRTGIGVNFAKVDAKAIEKILQTKWAGENYSQRIWNNRDKLVSELQTRLYQSIIRGDSIDRTTQILAGRMEVSYSSAARLVRTESSFIAHQATMDAYKASGVVEKYEYLATLDSRTSEICRSMDGKVFKLSEKQEGVNYPPLHPNCRSTVVPYFDDEIDPGKRIARNEDGKVYYIRGDMGFNEWKKQFVDGKISLKGSYSPQYAAKLQDTYKKFWDNGYVLTEHALNELLGRMANGRISSFDAVLDTIKNGKTYRDKDGSLVKYKNGLSVHFSSKTGKVKTIVPRKKPKKDWRESDGAD